MTGAIVWHEVGSGVFLLVYGVGFAALGRAMASRDSHLARTSESRWKFARFTQWRAFTARVSKEEWIERDQVQQRAFYRWIAVPAA